MILWKNVPILYNFIYLGDSEVDRNYNRANQDMGQRKVTKTDGKSGHLSYCSVIRLPNALHKWVSMVGERLLPVIDYDAEQMSLQIHAE